jgi:two-component system LytT family response regulator
MTVALRANITSSDNNDVFIQSYEIAIGNSYREAFFEELVNRLVKKS